MLFSRWLRTACAAVISPRTHEFDALPFLPVPPCTAASRAARRRMTAARRVRKARQAAKEQAEANALARTTSDVPADDHLAGQADAVANAEPG